MRVWLTLLLGLTLAILPSHGMCCDAMAAAAVAQDDEPATAVIVGPANAAPGDLIVLDGSSSEADVLVWVLAGSDKSFLPVDGGQRCVFATGAIGRYHFLLCTARNGSTAASVAVAQHVITIGNPTPGPQPIVPVPPKPGPQPDKPALTGSAKTAYDAAMALDRRPGEASGLADELESIAAKAVALSWSMPQLIAECGKRTVYQAAESKARWLPFNAAFAGIMRTRTTVAAASEALTEIATGLRATEGPATSESAPPRDEANETIRGMIQTLRSDLQGIRQEVGP